MSSPADPLRVLIADDDTLVRRLVKDILRNAGLVVVAEARTGREALELAIHYRPDVVLIDVVMPEMDGVLATRRIVEAVPGQVVVMLSGADVEAGDEVAIQALQAGAVGFLSKELDLEALPRVLKGVFDGEAALSRRMTLSLVERLRRNADTGAGARPAKSPLTNREWEIIDLLREHKTTEQIASGLVLSTETVRSHVRNITRKLGVHSRREAVAAADGLRPRG